MSKTTTLIKTIKFSHGHKVSQANRQAKQSLWVELLVAGQKTSRCFIRNLAWELLLTLSKLEVMSITSQQFLKLERKKFCLIF